MKELKWRGEMDLGWGEVGVFLLMMIFG